LQLLFDNTGNLTVAVNGLPDFAMNANEDYAFVFRPPCSNCVFSFSEIGLLLRERDEHLANISIYLSKVELDLIDGNIVSSTRVSPIFSYIIELFDPVLPYKFPFTASTYTTTGEYFAIEISSQQDVWWRFPNLIPALPTVFQGDLLSFQQEGYDGKFTTYANNPPCLTEYFPSIYVAGGQQCAPATPSPSASRSPSASGTPSPSASPSHDGQYVRRRLWDSPASTPSATASITPSPSATPCVGTFEAPLFSNIDTDSVLELLDMVRLKAHEPFAITFTPPCSGCTFNVTAIDMILKSSTVHTDASFKAELCQYDNTGTHLVNCVSSANRANFTLMEIPTLVTTDLEIKFIVGSGLRGDLKLIFTPSVDMQWMMSELAPAYPRTGASNVTSVLVQPPCDGDLVSVATFPITPCTVTSSWEVLRVFPSMNVYGVFPCTVPVPCLMAVNLHEQITFNEDLAGACDSETVVDIIDTIKNLTLTNTAALRALPNATAYTLWFENPCSQAPPFRRMTQEECTWLPTSLVLPLQALSHQDITLTIYYHDGPPGTPAAFSATHVIHLPDPTVIAFETVSLLGDFTGSGTNIQGVTLVFSEELLWHYGLPLVSFSFQDFPYITVESATLPINVDLYHGFVLPGVRLTGELVNGYCYDVPCFPLLPDRRLQRYDDQCSGTLLVGHPLPVHPPIPCFGSGSILVADNTLEGRFLFAAGTLMVPEQLYALHFPMPCSQCNVHLTHLTLPLGLFNDDSIEVNISVAILKNGLPSEFVVDPLTISLWSGISSRQSVHLTSPRGFYTLLLPNSFTLAALVDPSLSYALVLKVSKPLLWFDGLALPQYATSKTGYSDPIARLLVENDEGIFEQSNQIPGSWLRSWAEPWWQCIAPSPSPSHHVVPYVSATPSRIPVSLISLLLHLWRVRNLMPLYSADQYCRVHLL
jgi:hypothetical protein